MWKRVDNAPNNMPLISFTEENQNLSPFFKSIVVAVHALKMYRRSRGIAPLILNLGPR